MNYLNHHPNLLDFQNSFGVNSRRQLIVEIAHNATTWRKILRLLPTGLWKLHRIKRINSAACDQWVWIERINRILKATCSRGLRRDPRSCTGDVEGLTPAVYTALLRSVYVGHATAPLRVESLRRIWRVASYYFKTDYRGYGMCFGLLDTKRLQIFSV